MEAINFILILSYLLCLSTVFYMMFFSIAGHFYKRKKYESGESGKRIAVLIPAYKEDVVIVQSARQALFQDYPGNKYDVYVIADSLKKETIVQLKQLPITVIEVQFDISTKAKALNKAFELIEKPYEIAVILDADNIMKNDFLSLINAAFQSGCYAIQGHRTAKNRNTRFAILDAISEEVNNHVMRKGQVAVGLSSAIIGSGMAFSYRYLKQVMAEINAVGGFDKELEITLIDDNHKIAYLDNAIVLDEKVQKSEVFANQRTRWVAAQLTYLKRYWLKGLYNLVTGRIDYANKVMHYAIVPKVLLLGFLMLMMLCTAFLPDLRPGFMSWTTLLGCYLFAYALAIPRSFWNMELLKAVSGLPKTILVMVLAMFRIRSANKKFIHTPHSASFGNSNLNTTQQ
jgi:cellulose synthase/poly-beta-1,6-N-acetylglucosamine synthase-like glycosyltransferase